ncbi:MAG: Acetyl-CoA acetyltransferase [Planctomycetota bacterium]|jgi:acetyl-CoA C-acetyltransferase
MVRERVMIVAAKRTPFGRFRGGLSGLGPLELVGAATGAIFGGSSGSGRSGVSVDRESISRVVLGQCLAAGHGMNIARRAILSCGLPETSTGFVVNMMCGSGLKAMALGAELIWSGEARAVLAGGVESMSRSPLLVSRPGRGQAVDVGGALDSMLVDGLRDIWIDEHMGETAERVSRECGVSREEQDLWALRSQSLYASALEAGFYGDELAEVGGLSVDEHPRPGVTKEDLAALRPVFAEYGTVTAGNSSGINDGAAVAVLASESLVRERGWDVLCEWVGCYESGCDPHRMGLGPVYALRGLLERHGLGWGDIDQLEINEAFGAQVAACVGVLGLGAAASQGAVGDLRPFVNPHGGAIALGHPLAASGARLAVHLAWQIARGRVGVGVCSLCIGGGMGIAALLRRPR